MKIAGTEVNLKHRALEVYLSGCRPPHCPGCHNPELWDFSVGEDFDPFKLEQSLYKKFIDLKKNGLVDILWLLGGEPLDQDLNQLEKMLSAMELFDIPVMLWTHYPDIPRNIRKLVKYAKIGPYMENDEAYIEPVFGIKLANREQRIIKIGRDA